MGSDFSIAESQSQPASQLFLLNSPQIVRIPDGPVVLFMEQDSQMSTT